MIVVEDSNSAYCFGYDPGVLGEHFTIQLLLTTALLLVTRFNLIYLCSRCVFLVTGVNQENWKAEDSAKDKRWSSSVKIANSLNWLTQFLKESSTTDVRMGSRCASHWR